MPGIPYSVDPLKYNIYNSNTKITTVDKFQGQQNDYILLSMVRTDYVGYLRDIRRIIVGIKLFSFRKNLIKIANKINVS